MIVDVHSHVFGVRADEMSDRFQTESDRAHGGHVDLTVRYDDYAAAAPPSTRTIVVGGKARHSGLWVDDTSVASYVAAHHDELIGYLAIDPTQEGWRDELCYGHQELGLRGVKIMPTYAGFDPADPAYDDLHSYAEQNALPLLVHTGTTFVTAAQLKWAH